MTAQTQMHRVALKLRIMKRTFKQWWSSFPLILTKWTIIFHLIWTRWTQKNHDIWRWKSKTWLGTGTNMEHRSGVEYRERCNIVTSVTPGVFSDLTSWHLSRCLTLFLTFFYCVSDCLIWENIKCSPLLVTNVNKKNYLSLTIVKFLLIGAWVRYLFSHTN
jgi:hypothetical protein